MSRPRRLIIHEVSRFPASDPSDTLTFDDGVNVIVGVPNTGKSKWLRMIDYILGNEHSPTEVFTEDIATKYTSIRAVVTAGSTKLVITRRWDDPKLATKVQVNDEWMAIYPFTLRLMDALGIPVLHYPQGNPYGSRTWPELGWRSLYRHVYRRQNFWTDLADRQYESEQHACLIQFVGIAARLFSKEYGDLVGLQKQIQKLQDDRERFVETLQEVSRELLDERELGVALTPASITVAIARQEAGIGSLRDRKQAAVRDAIDVATSPDAGSVRPANDRNATVRLGEALAGARAEKFAGQTSLKKSRNRLEELRAYRGVLDAELGRLRRANEATTLLSDLKITHCPACDRPIDKPDEAVDHCYLCKRPNVSSVRGGADERLKFEVQQLQGDLLEANELIQRMSFEVDALAEEDRNLSSQIADLESKLRPTTEAVTAVLPPELFVLDQEIGRRQERIAQLRRIESTLARREAIADQIKVIQVEVAELEATVKKQSAQISFEKASDNLTDGINTYLNEINARRTPGPWTQGEVDFMLKERGFAIRIKKSDWKAKLGGTLTLYFLIAYHYSLLLLGKDPESHFPGLCILDFPAELDGASVSDSENFVLEPFVNMAARGDVGLQVIAAGSSFAGLEGAKRINLSTVWA